MPIFVHICLYLFMFAYGPLKLAKITHRLRNFAIQRSCQNRRVKGKLQSLIKLITQFPAFYGKCKFCTQQRHFHHFLHEYSKNAYFFYHKATRTKFELLTTKNIRDILTKFNAISTHSMQRNERNGTYITVKLIYTNLTSKKKHNILYICH